GTDPLPDATVMRRSAGRMTPVRRLWLDGPERRSAGGEVMPLKLRIPAGEKIVVNGAVITNVDDRAMYIQLENEAQFMRGRDILRPEDVVTPLDEAYFHVQMMYIEPDSRTERRPQFVDA